MNISVRFLEELSTVVFSISAEKTTRFRQIRFAGDVILESSRDKFVKYEKKLMVKVLSVARYQ